MEVHLCLPRLKGTGCSAGSTGTGSASGDRDRRILWLANKIIIVIKISKELLLPSLTAAVIATATETSYSIDTFAFSWGK